MQITWPPAYTLKKHARAKRVKLKASIQHGLEIVVPASFDNSGVLVILENNRRWIEKNLAQINSTRHLIKTNPVPLEIKLPALNENWQVTYIKSLGTKIKLLERPGQELIVLGNIENHTLCIKTLTKWIKEKAAVYLTEQLRWFSEKTQLTFNTVQIRSQQTRWGSCSNNKSINLNYQLLFLPARLLHHILIHELCHTIHMDHSSAFWKLVAAFDPDSNFHRKEVKKALSWVPHWVTYLG